MTPLRIVHMDIAAKDPAASSKFYADLCGWQIEVDPNFNYHQFSSGEGQLAGGFPLTGNDYKPGDVIPYLGVENVNQFLDRVVALGGQVLTPKTPIPGIGSFAFFADPTGNRIGAFSSEQ